METGSHPGLAQLCAPLMSAHTHPSPAPLRVHACGVLGLGLARSTLHVNMCECHVGEPTHLTLEPNRRIYPLTDGWLGGS